MKYIVLFAELVLLLSMIIPMMPKILGMEFNPVRELVVSGAITLIVAFVEPKK